MHPMIPLWLRLMQVKLITRLRGFAPSDCLRIPRFGVSCNISVRHMRMDEVLVSCRKRNRPLFRLPSPEALGQITSSDAVCSECGVKLADERFDELIIPTPAASVLLNDGSWL